MKLTVTDGGEYALSLSKADRTFLVHSLITSQTHVGDVEYEIVTGWSKSVADSHRDAWRMAPDEAGGYVLTLAQSDLNFVLTSLRLCITHVSDAEYEIVIGRRRQDSANELAYLEDQAERAFSERISRELDGKNAWQVCLAMMGDLSLLADEVLTARLASEAAELGAAIEGQERQRAILLQAAIDALLAELRRRGADVNAVLARMLGSGDAGARFTAASRLLPTTPARVTLKALADPGKPELAKAAARVLRRWRRGEYMTKKATT